MENPNFWKEKYSFLWDPASKREEIIKKFIEQLGYKVEYYGLGAGTTNFISGSARDNDKEKGAPDLHIVGTNIFIEVTGSFGKNTKAEDPIWIRTDKLDYAHKHRFENEEFFVVNYKFADVWYVIHYNNELIEHIRATKEKTDFRTIHPFIKRCRETFVEIDSQSKYVQDLSYLKKYLEMKK